MRRYTNDMKHKGFTVVELLVVIVVIIILATITIASYAYLRDDAMDTKIKTTVKSAGDAMQLYESRNNGRITGVGYFSNANGVDSLVSDYLKVGYRDGLTSKNSANANQIFRWYNCGSSTADGFVVYASLNNPTSEDIDRFTTIRTSCGHTATQAPTSGGVIYNYAQVF